jgi:hypothetical protein
MKTPGAGSPSRKITSPFLKSRRTAIRANRFRLASSTCEKKEHEARTSAMFNGPLSCRIARRVELI